MNAPDMSTNAASEQPTDFGRHNMFAFGRTTLFLSHLPMFMRPHDAQLILEAALENPQGSLQDAWSRERESHPAERMYTMMPEKFSLSSLYDRDPPERDSFRATFFRGHLERGGVAIPELIDVTVRITRVVHAHRFDRTERPRDLSYLLVGRGEELFLAHLIRQAPDFDQILSVGRVAPPPTEDQLDTGISVVLPGQENTAQARLRGGTRTARGHVTGAHQFLDLEVTDIQELYFEEGELADPAVFDSTRLESEAGFE